MSDLVVVMFKDESTAFEMRAALAKMQAEYLIEMDRTVSGIPLNDTVARDLESLASKFGIWANFFDEFVALWPRNRR